MSKRVRDYAHEYASYHSKPEQVKNRAMRNAARAEVTKKLGAAAVAGKDVDHKIPIRSGGGNSASNLRPRSVAANRGWRKGQK